MTARRFLLTRLICAKCGHNLSIADKAPACGSTHSIDEPTGAQVFLSQVAIEPCQNCSAPADNLKHAAERFLASLEGGAQ